VGVLGQRQFFVTSSDSPESIKFKHSVILFQHNGDTYRGIFYDQNPFTSNRIAELEDVQLIPPDAHQPRLPDGVTVVPGDADGLYVKRPNIFNYTKGRGFADAILREIGVCEILLHHPHCNMAEYKGCLVSNGRVEGICFEEYPQSLFAKVNPQSLTKSEFLQNRQVSEHDAARYLEGVEAGIKHLHSLGYVHNDVSPMNIMISDNDDAVIVDFDSCVEIGAPLQGIKRTSGWHDAECQTAEKSNDFAALEELRVWLLGHFEKNYRFSDC
jgi:serine/threonine protein kinase